MVRVPYALLRTANLALSEYVMADYFSPDGYIAWLRANPAENFHLAALVAEKVRHVLLEETRRAHLE